MKRMSLLAGIARRYVYKSQPHTPFPVMYAAGNITGGQLKDIMGGKE
ncbi:hypothetical protein [Mailhella massiliensis]|nr:hypothetical protein [Mailhella massiliensis]